MRRTSATALLVALLTASFTISAKADPHFDSCSQRTGDNATLIIPAAVADIGGSPFESADELAIFTPDGVCAGLLEWDGANAALALWEDDPMTEAVDGFVAGDPMTYVVWDASESAEYGRDYGTVHITYDDAHTVSDVFEPEAVYQAAAISVTVPVSAEQSVADVFALEGNYPNPFTDRTTIVYDLPESSRVSLEVYNLLGHRVSVLVDGPQSAGRHEVDFDAGSELTSGVYVYRLRAGTLATHRKMTLVN